MLPPALSCRGGCGYKLSLQEKNTVWTQVTCCYLLMALWYDMFFSQPTSAASIHIRPTRPLAGGNPNRPTYPPDSLQENQLSPALNLLQQMHAKSLQLDAGNGVGLLGAGWAHVDHVGVAHNLATSKATVG